MSEYLPSFIVEPVLRQARRFSERIGSEDSPAGATTSTFALPAVPDLQRFYPTRFWSQSPLATAVVGDEGLAEANLNHSGVPEESTLRSIARNIQLWANQINNLDVEEEVIQEPVLNLVEQDDSDAVDTNVIFTEEPEIVDSATERLQFPRVQTVTQLESRSLPLLGPLRQPQRTISDTSMNPANELSHRSQILERHAQGRSQSVPLAAINVADTTVTTERETMEEEYEDGAYDRPSDGSRLLPEDDGMRPLRKRINAVWAGPGTAQEKSRSVHALMTERYRSKQATATATPSTIATSPPFRATSPLSLASVKSDETLFNLTPSDFVPTYAPLNPDENLDDSIGEIQRPILGCVHYQRNVKMQCAVCERWYTCRICHDEQEDHQLPRKETRNMLCMVCRTPQRVSQVCKACHVQAAYYYCSTCKLWNNDANKSIYHCDDCGICRLGQGLGKDFFHCKTCAACMSIAAESTHRCIEKSTKCDCPICGEFMFTSSQPVTFMRCGHSIHEDCFNEWCNTSYKCPICSKSIANMESQFRRLDRHIEDQPMPEEYSHNRAYVFCNDCNSRSVVKYHWLGLKCANCDSYNTAQLELLGPESPAIQERADRALEMGIGEAGMTASQGQTPIEEPTSSASRPSTGRATPTTTSSIAREDSNGGAGTPRSAINIPGRRNSPFHHLPHSPSRSTRAMSPVIGSYFGTGQRPPPSENRRGSYFSVLSFGTATDENSAQASSSAAAPRPSSASRFSKSFLSPPVEVSVPRTESLNRETSLLEDDEDMDFWGGHSPRSNDADIVDLDLESKEEDEYESSSDEDGGMEDDEEEADDEDPMDILIGHR